MFSPRKYPPEETQRKLANWCDRKEHTHWQAREKLIEWGVPHREREELIGNMIEKNLINESRYASAFASDKFRFYRWGAIKIKVALKANGVSEANINAAIRSLPQTEIVKSIRGLVEKKLQQCTGLKIYQKKMKVARFIIGKGFPPELVWKEIEMAFMEST
ncbi:MAG: regulatory protein RecX [Flavobacteriales bacterium]|nr:regulatory protein RecX [Flavobacteriales bacterium]